MERFLGWKSWAGPRTTARAWTRGVATVGALAFMTPCPGATAASDWVLRAVLSEDAATVEEALLELGNALHGPFDGQLSVDSVGAWFREDVDLAWWFGEVLARGRPEAREAVSEFLVGWIGIVPPLEWIEFAARNHTSAQEMFEGWPPETLPEMFRGDVRSSVPTMEFLRRKGSGLLAELPETVADDEARRLALAFASQMRRIQAALPRLVKEEYDRSQRSGTISADEVIEVLLGGLVVLQQWGTEETRAAAWAKWVEKREAQSLPTVVVGVEAPWNLFGNVLLHHELGESGYPLEGRTLAPGVRRVALALTEDVPAELGPDHGAGRWESVQALEFAVTLLANERPLAEETGRRVFDLYCGMPVGIRSASISLDGGCFEKLNLLYAGPDDPSLRSMEADVGGHVLESLAGLIEEADRQCGTLAESEADGREEPPAGGVTWSRAEGETEYRVTVPVRERIRSIGEHMQEVLALVGRLDTVSRPLLDGVFEYWSKERFPEARRILEENDWLGPDVAAVSSAQKDGVRAGWSPAPRRRIGIEVLCEGRI
jgi:hypothetical protein